jgi:hypothetical protein
MSMGRLAAFPPAGNSKLPPALAMEAGKSALRGKAAAAGSGCSGTADDEPARGGLPPTGGRPASPDPEQVPFSWNVVAQRWPRRGAPVAIAPSG